MSTEEEYMPEFKPEEPKKPRANISANVFKGVLDGSLLTKEGFISQLPYILFLSLLDILYIGNRYHAESIIRKKDALQKEIKEFRAEAITTASQLMKISRQSEVFELVDRKGLDLKETTEPPKKLRMEE